MAAVKRKPKKRGKEKKKETTRGRKRGEIPSLCVTSSQDGIEREGKGEKKGKNPGTPPFAPLKEKEPREKEAFQISFLWGAQEEALRVLIQARKGEETYFICPAKEEKGKYFFSWINSLPSAQKKKREMVH